MGFLDWVQKKSSDKCRDNLTRGIPMFVEVCKRMDACEERKLSLSLTTQWSGRATRQAFSTSSVSRMWPAAHRGR